MTTTQNTQKALFCKIVLNMKQKTENEILKT